MRRLSSKGASCLPKGCLSEGTSHTASTFSVARTKCAARRWPTWGGLKEPPMSATSMPCFHSSVEQVGPAPLLEGHRGVVEQPGHLGERCSALEQQPYGVSAAQQVEGGLVTHEFVRVRAPGEVLGRRG